MNKFDVTQQNLIINGGMNLWQRGGVSSAINLTTSATYSSVDRYKVSYSGTVTGTPQIQAETSILPNYAVRAAKVTFQRNSGSFTFIAEQRIESMNTLVLASYGYGSLKMQVMSPISGTQVRLTLLYPNTADDHSIQTQFYQDTKTLTTTSIYETVKFENISIPSNVVKGLAVKIEIIVPSGTDLSSQALFLGNIMLQPGKKCSNLFLIAGKNIVEETSLCLRYFEITTKYSFTFAKNIDFVYTNTNGGYGLPLWQYSVIKRTNPTLKLLHSSSGFSFYEDPNLSHVLRSDSYTDIAAYGDIYGCFITFVSGSGSIPSSVGAGAYIYSIYVKSDAEL